MAQGWVPTRRKLWTLAILGVALGVVSRSRRKPSPLDAGSGVKRVLVVELGNIGDIVLLTPFLAELREIFPGAAVSLLAKPETAEILTGVELCDELIPADVLTRVRSTYNPLEYDWAAVRGLIRELREREFDVAFQCRPHIREHVLLALSGARRTVGYAFAGGGADRLLTDSRPRDDVDRHKAEDWLRLLEPFGAKLAAQPRPHLRSSEDELVAAKQFLTVSGATTGDRVVAVHPGASVAEKRWPLERFAAVADALLRQDDLCVLALVDPGGYGSALGHIPGVIAAQPSLRQLMALTQSCDLLVCNDSGPMHIAAAFGVPTVALFGPGDPRWFGPLGAGHQVLTPDPGESLGDIPAERVAAAAMVALGRARRT